MTFSDLQTALIEQLELPSTPASAVTTRLNRSINTAYRTVLRSAGLSLVRDSSITFASVSGRVQYGLPQSIDTIQAIRDTTNGRRLVGLSRDEWRDRDPGSQQTGTPTHYVWLGEQATEVALSTTSDTLATASPPTVANQGAGAYAATLRYYRLRQTRQITGITVARSSASTSVSFTPSGAGAAAEVSYPAVTDAATTHWELEASTDNSNFYRLVTVAIGAASSLDSAAVSTYASGTYSVDDNLQVYVKSTSPSDTNIAYVEAIRTNGHSIAMSVVMTGTTPVALSGSALDLVEITRFYLSAAAAGAVTLHQTHIALTELARIRAGNSFARYQGIALWPTPTAAVTYDVDYGRNMRDLSNTTDEPLFSKDFHWVIVEGALALEYRKANDDRAIDAEARFQQGIKDLRYHISCPPDYLPVSGRRSVGSSRLGGWYPNGAGWR